MVNEMNRNEEQNIANIWIAFTNNSTKITRRRMNLSINSWHIDQRCRHNSIDYHVMKITAMKIEEIIYDLVLYFATHSI